MRNGHNLAHLFHGTGIAGIAEHRQAVETGDDLAQNFEPLGGRIVVTGEEVSVIFDIMPDTTGNGLHFEFEMAMITREELCRFGEWLAESSYGGTVHCVSRPCTGCARRPWGHF